MRLKELRIASGTTQKDVADSIGCTATVYSRYEREEREPDIEMLCRLANYFQVSIDYLVENNPSNKEVPV
ncbi:MAG: helix-turn-helix transcriptional regulator [Clostridia bacterium]|nr:helix-turn-helix transcriptional regulator [Clostridia bacterium]